MKKQKKPVNKNKFVHIQSRKTLTPWADAYKLCWYVNESFDYVFEHRNTHFICNGFSISKSLIERLPKGKQTQYLDSSQRVVVFSTFWDEIMCHIDKETNVSDTEFMALFAIPKSVFMSNESKQTFVGLMDD